MRRRDVRLLVNAAVGLVTAGYGVVGLLHPSALDRRTAAPSALDRRTATPSALDRGTATPSALDRGTATPSALDRGTATPSRYFARMYAARAIPLGVAVAWDSVSAARTGRAPSTAPGLTAAAAQAGDALVGLRAREPGQVAGALIGATAHLVAGLPR